MARSESIREVLSNSQDEYGRIFVFFKPHLQTLGLDRDQITSQSRQQLEKSLERVNEAIKDYKAFGTAKMKMTGDGLPVLVCNSSDYHIELTILPVLLEQKKQILERLDSLGSQEKITSLRDLIDRVQDENIKSLLTTQLDQLGRESEQWKIKLEQLQQQREYENAKSQEEIIRRIATIESQVNGKDTIKEKALTDELAIARSQRDKYYLILRFIFGVLLVVIGAVGIIYIPAVVSWQWLIQHPKKLGLQISAILVIFGAVWLFLDRNSNRRWFAFSSVILATVVGLIQII